MEQGLTKNKILSELSRSPHGKLQEYVPIGRLATKNEPEFMAHLISWDRFKGQIRDAKVALPVVSLSVPGFHQEFVENSLAHITLLNPRELIRVFRFSKEIKISGRMKEVRRLIEYYLRDKESNVAKWDRLAVQHRGSLKELYGLVHAKPGERAQNVLFRGNYPHDSIFDLISRLKDMSPAEAAGTIMTNRIPFLIASGALGVRVKEPDVILALINAMSATELVTNTKFLENAGMKANPVLRGAYEKALEKASSSKKNVLKTTKAAERMTDDSLKAKLQGLQDRQIENISIDGNWLVLGDKSSSMQHTIEWTRMVAATLAKMVKGKVWLVFFNESPQTIDVTGCSLEVIQKATRYINASGGTSIGCGLQRMLEANEEVDGIAVVSDAAENTTPFFPQVYKKYCEKYSKEIPVYLYRTEDMYPGHYATRDLAKYMKHEGFDLQEFDLTKGIDHYSLPNLVQTMRMNRYSLVDEVMATPLLEYEYAKQKVA
jgi:hypothetical protein